MNFIPMIFATLILAAMVALVLTDSVTSNE